jgi:hypothetical protein
MKRKEVTIDIPTDLADPKADSEKRIQNPRAVLTGPAVKLYSQFGNGGRQDSASRNADG